MVSDGKELIFLLFQLLQGRNILKHQHCFADQAVGRTNGRGGTEHYDLATIRSRNKDLLIRHLLAPQSMDERKIPAKYRLLVPTRKSIRRPQCRLIKGSPDQVGQRKPK